MFMEWGLIHLLNIALIIVLLQVYYVLTEVLKLE